ncbi:hypothetical protein PAEPH01_0196 [Pancytospora epiphaga]|nr:hypothetical protein PAEPH01_0196 [Pancytospora epiphaga]
MYSYTERLATFARWPEELRKTLIKKLAIIGQYATPNAELTTTCVYCRKNMEGWKARDVPLVEHMKHNDNCIIFHIEWLPARRYLFDLQEQNLMLKESHPFEHINWTKFSRYFKADGKSVGHNREDDPRKDGPMVRFDIKEGVPFVFCIYCGSIGKAHKCALARNTRRNLGVLTKERMFLTYFYIKWLRGEYLEMIDCYLNYEVYIPNDKKDLLKNLLSQINDEEVFAIAGVKVRRAVEQLVREFDLELQKMERKSLKMINEKADE